MIVTAPKPRLAQKPKLKQPIACPLVVTHIPKRYRRYRPEVATDPQAEARVRGFFERMGLTVPA